MSAAKWGAVVALLCALYGYGLFRDPAKWEEPRRALVSLEMIASGDYIVPRLLGETYLNKPPLFNWLGLAVAGNRAERVGPAVFRIVSLIALVVVCFLLWRLGVSGLNPRPDPLAALVFATMGIVVQYGRAGEIDMLLCALTTTALACFEFGRRRRSMGLQWIVPQAFVGFGILTKIVAPAFFYPAVLFTAWRRPKEYTFSTSALFVGMVLMTIIVGAWVFAYSQRQPLAPLEARWISEFARRFRAPDVAATPWHLVGHIFHYPVVVLGTVLPWTLWLGVLLWREPRRSFAAALGDPFLYLAAVVTIVVVLGHALAVEGRGRYLLPAFPFVAVLLARVIRDAQGKSGEEAETDAALDAGTAAGAGTTAGADAVTGPGQGKMRRFVTSGRAFSWTLSVALLYATIYVATTERARARTGYRYRAEAGELAATLDPSLPVVIDRAVPYRFVFPLYLELGELPRAVAPVDSAYEWIASSATVPPTPGKLVAESGRFRVWEIEKVADSGS